MWAWTLARLLSFSYLLFFWDETSLETKVLILAFFVLGPGIEILRFPITYNKYLTIWKRSNA